MDVALFSSSTWFYIDSLGIERGPFRPDEMWRWYKAGYFPGDLMVRRTIQSAFTRIASLALGNANQPMVNFGPPAMHQNVSRRDNVRDGNPFETVKEEGSNGTSVDKDRGIQEEGVGSFLKPKQEFKEKRAGKIEVKKEYVETEIKDEYIKPEVQDEYIKSVKLEVKDEYIKPEVKNEYIKTELKLEYIESEIEDEYIKPEVRDEYIKPEVRGEFTNSVKLDVKDEYIKPEVKNEYIKTEFKLEYIESEIKEEYLWKCAVLTTSQKLVGRALKRSIRHIIRKEESLKLAINQQIVMLKNKYGGYSNGIPMFLFKKDDVFTITGLSKSGKSLWLNNGTTLVPVNARGSLYDIFIPSENEEIGLRTKIGSMKQPTEVNEKNNRKGEVPEDTRALKTKRRYSDRRREEKARKNVKLDKIKEGDDTTVVIAARNDDNGKKLENVVVSRDSGNNEMLEKAMDTDMRNSESITEMDLEANLNANFESEADDHGDEIDAQIEPHLISPTGPEVFSTGTRPSPPSSESPKSSGLLKKKEKRKLSGAQKCFRDRQRNYIISKEVAENIGNIEAFMKVIPKGIPTTRKGTANPNVEALGKRQPKKTASPAGSVLGSGGKDGYDPGSLLKNAVAKTKDVSKPKLTAKKPASPVTRKVASPSLKKIKQATQCHSTNYTRTGTIS